ncbi:mannose-1-phosphate guanylyltransferase [Ulvibacter litoralis]|uniref:mannose-1-phosphate guanylyltransferase n=1 Tax=Ulvibacter litoralis TaxID=227084 RepID=A0A1G7C1D6_9FLAO|nr:mannose-1-phosphate guanylyltransferase [Ulvibacter litoralis]GHC49018.1 mannose-1-phosphate guanylyltransferase [Ulvibacter litoralis]SDE33089.1 mannose-1-phosphate guanylyltransferase [Ulvibacter litoralis]
MKNDYYAVIMAGGIGSRFWPVSRAGFPKQFHDMLGTGQTLLQKTFSRLNAIIPSENIVILTNDRYLDITLEQLPEINQSQVILEPAMRNTAPCILMAALKIKKQNPNAVMLVAPSDHWIEDEAAFANDVEVCFTAAQNNDMLVTLGIQPTFPNTGYGYIENEKNSTSEIKKVKQFREKPNYETAKQFIAEGNFVWNAGIFIWSVKSITASFETYMPTMTALFEEGNSVFNTSEEKEFIDKQYGLAENISIDYGILEKANNVFVKKATFDWNDLGTWGALHDKLEKDEDNNATVRATTHLVDASDNMIYTASEKLVVIDGITDYIVVDTDDVLLLFPKKKEQKIKELLTEISHKFGVNFT